MKINKETIQKGFKNQFITVLHMIVFNIISFVVLSLANIGTKPTGKIYNGVIARGEYKANYWCVIFFWVLLMILFSIFYKKFLKVDLKKQIHTHWCFVIMFFITTIFFCLIEFAILIITLLMVAGFGIISNYPNFIPIVALVYIIGYIIVDLICEKRKSK